MKLLYKNKLAEYCKKNKLTLPIYSCDEQKGSSHCLSSFKATVNIDGQAFESPEGEGLFYTVKDAEHAAAKVALMSLSPSSAQEASS